MREEETAALWFSLVLGSGLFFPGTWSGAVRLHLFVDQVKSDRPVVTCAPSSGRDIPLYVRP